MIWTPDVKVGSWLPTGKVGDWEVRRFTIIGKQKYEDISPELTPPGEYTELIGPGGEKWMSDEPNEFISTARFCKEAAGTVLITGLGIGFVPSWLVRNSQQVTSITIIELNEEVTQLVGSRLQLVAKACGVPLAIKHGNGSVADGDRYDVALHDHFLVPTTEQCESIVDEWRPFVSRQFVWRFVEPLLEIRN